MSEGRSLQRIFYPTAFQVPRARCRQKSSHKFCNFPRHYNIIISERRCSKFLGLRDVRQRSRNREAFEYEPTDSIIGTGRHQPFCILEQTSCILGKTFGSCLGSYSATADCWLWLHGARLRETVEGA